MKSFLLLLIIVVFNQNENNLKKELKCSDFRNGKFELINLKNNKKFVIERHDEVQSEETYNLENGEMIGSKRFFKIKWISDCEYNILVDTVKTKCDKIDLYINSKGGVNTKIISIENNCANVGSTFENKTIEAKLCKIN